MNLCCRHRILRAYIGFVARRNSKIRILLTATFAAVAAGLWPKDEASADGVRGSALNWGRLVEFVSQAPQVFTPGMSTVVTLAGDSLNTVSKPVAAFHLQGTLNIDPAHREADEAKQNFPGVLALAICARLEQVAIHQACLTKAASVLLDWVGTYRPSGNPINDQFMTPLLQSADLVMPELPPRDRERLSAWLREFAAAGDRFYIHVPPEHPSRANNWMAARLLIRALTSTIVDDAGMQAETRNLFDDFIARNFVTGADGTRNGATFDFIQRDALYYHVVDLRSLAEIALYTPAITDANTRKIIEKGIDFLKPYYLGERQHIEFQNTTVPFDAKRINEDRHNSAFQLQPWKPAGAQLLLLLGRALFPGVRSWTGNPSSEDLAPQLAILAALYDQN